MKYPYRAKTWLLLNGIPRFLSLVMVILLLTIGCGQKGKEMIEHVEPQKPKELEMENATTKEVDIETDILLAKEHIMLGRYEEAISLLKELAKANPENAAIYYLLGTAYEEANLNELSVEAFVKALQIDPDIESKIGYE